MADMANPADSATQTAQQQKRQPAPTGGRSTPGGEPSTPDKKHDLPDAPRKLPQPFAAMESVAEFVGEATLLAGQTMAVILRGGVSVSNLIAQMAAIGVDSVAIVLICTVATGAVFSFYIANFALTVGFTQLVGGTLGFAFLNELGPVLGGVAFASRAGAAIAAEIGSMVVTEQVDALRAMAVSPIRYLVAPRVLAAVLMLPLLIVLGDVAGLWGGYIFAGLKGIPHAAFAESVRAYVQPVDMLRGIIKAIFFAFIVGIVACQQGLRTKGGATGVGRATTSSVVLCVLLIFISDFFLAQVLTQAVQQR